MIAADRSRRRLNGRLASIVIGLTGAVLALGTSTTAAAGAPTCFGQAATILGHPGSERIEGTPDSDVIIGLGGRDIIAGGDGDDLICGNNGSDVIDGGAGNDS